MEIAAHFVKFVKHESHVIQHNFDCLQVPSARRWSPTDLVYYGLRNRTCAWGIRMREMEFRRVLSKRLRERSIDSYVAYCRRVERDAGVDLDICDLSEPGIAALGSLLRAAGVQDKSLSNCLSGLRAYAGLAGTAAVDRAAAGQIAFTLAQPRSAESPPNPRVQIEAETPPTRRESVGQATVSELLALYGEIMDELRGRCVVRTGNSPVGDYAELLFATAFGWLLEPNSASGHDATDAQGIRYQIKGRLLSSLSASRQLSAIRRLPEQTFDYLAAVLFDPRFKVSRAILIPHAVVTARARRVEHTNSWTFTLDDRVWRERGVTDATAEIAVAAAKL